MRSGVLGPVVCALLTVACGDAISSPSEDDSGDYTCPSGCVYVTRDNPELRHDSLLLREDSIGVFEVSERDDDAWSYDWFRFQITQTGNNPATGAEMRDDLQVWPTRSGRVEPVAGQTARLDWSIPGVQVGYSDLRIGVSKLRTVTRPSTYTETTRESETTAFRLRPDVILVPIQVARFYPGYSGAPDPSVTEIYNERRMRLLLDEQWKPKVLTTSHEGSLKKLVGHWEDWNQDDLHGWTHNYTPDSIFEQCGIQFRMVDYVEVPASQEWWEMTSNGALLCGSLSQGRLRTMRDAAVDAGLRSDLPIVMATRTLMNRGCAEWETVLELACNGSSCGGANWAVFESFHIGGVSQQYVVGHEFGHVVGLADLGPTNPQCSGEKRQLMCQYAALQSARIGDDVPGASCNQARTVAAAYAKRYFTTGGVDF